MSSRRRRGPFELPPELHRDTVCPYCLEVSPVTSNVTGTRTPTDGDFTLCAECAGLSVFDFSLPGARRPPTLSERVSIERDPDAMHDIAIAQRYLLATRSPFGPSRN